MSTTMSRLSPVTHTARAARRDSHARLRKADVKEFSARELRKISEAADDLFCNCANYPEHRLGEKAAAYIDAYIDYKSDKLGYREFQTLERDFCNAYALAIGDGTHAAKVAVKNAKKAMATVINGILGRDI